MKANRGRDTVCELELRRELYGLGMRYRVHVRILPGFRRQADIVFSRVRLAVFVDGCFWHGCPIHGTKAKANADYWDAKILQNRLRDLDTDERLREAGWTVLRFWEHQPATEAASQVLETYARLARSLG